MKIYYSFFFTITFALSITEESSKEEFLHKGGSNDEIVSTTESSIEDRGISDIWDGMQTQWNALTCKMDTDCKVCQSKGCDFCDFHRIVKLNMVDTFIPSYIQDMFNAVNEDILKKGFACGMGEELCESIQSNSLGLLASFNKCSATSKLVGTLFIPSLLLILLFYY